MRVYTNKQNNSNSGIAPKAKTHIYSPQTKVLHRLQKRPLPVWKVVGALIILLFLILMGDRLLDLGVRQEHSAQEGLKGESDAQNSATTENLNNQSVSPVPLQQNQPSTTSPTEIISPPQATTPVINSPPVVKPVVKPKPKAKTLRRRDDDED